MRVYNLTIDDVRAENNFALRHASENGHLDIVKYFVEEVGLTIDDIRTDNNEALRYASYNGHLETVKYLVEEVGLTIDDILMTYSALLYHTGEVVEYFNTRLYQEKVSLSPLL